MVESITTQRVEVFNHTKGGCRFASGPCPGPAPTPSPRTPALSVLRMQWPVAHPPPSPTNSFEACFRYTLYTIYMTAPRR
jgi:hypothetical protein